MNNSLISVITPVFNAALFLPRLFVCINSQRDVNLEHILVDDGSTDGSLNLMRRLANGNEKIKIIQLEKNSGPVLARNIAIREASGKYLAFLDADDYWLPEKSITQMNFMESSGAAISFTDYRFISEDGVFVGSRLRGPNKINWALHHMTRYLGCLTIMVNREKCPSFHFPNISPSYRAEDFLAWSEIIKHHKFAYRCPHDLARYAVVEGSRSSKKLRAVVSVWRLYRNVEKIPFIEALFYFVVYGVFTSLKRLIYRPKFDSRNVDFQIADSYQLMSYHK